MYICIPLLRLIKALLRVLVRNALLRLIKTLLRVLVRDGLVVVRYEQAL
jgi:hypothetical protein